MTEKIDWTDWYTTATRPELGDYIQVDSICLFCGAIIKHEALVVGWDYNRIKMAPEQLGNCLGAVMRWRKRIIGNLEETEDEREIELT